MLDIQIDWLGLALPLAYLVVLVGALMTFSSIYRKRKAGMFPPIATAHPNCVGFCDQD